MNRYCVTLDGDLTVDGAPFTSLDDRATVFTGALWDQMHARGLESPAVIVDGDGVLTLSMIIETMHSPPDLTVIEASLNTQVILVRTDECSPHWDPHKWEVVGLAPKAETNE